MRSLYSSCINNFCPVAIPSSLGEVDNGDMEGKKIKRIRIIEISSPDFESESDKMIEVDAETERMKRRKSEDVRSHAKFPKIPTFSLARFPMTTEE